MVLDRLIVIALLKIVLQCFDDDVLIHSSLSSIIPLVSLFFMSS